MINLWCLFFLGTKVSVWWFDFKSCGDLTFGTRGERESGNGLRQWAKNVLMEIGWFWFGLSMDWAGLDSCVFWFWVWLDWLKGKH